MLGSRSDRYSHSMSRDIAAHDVRYPDRTACEGERIMHTRRRFP